MPATCQIEPYMQGLSMGRKGDLVDILWSRRKTVVSGVVR
jgi:hypothetical protein